MFRTVENSNRLILKRSQHTVAFKYFYVLTYAFRGQGNLNPLNPPVRSEKIDLDGVASDRKRFSRRRTDARARDTGNGNLFFLVRYTAFSNTFFSTQKNDANNNELGITEQLQELIEKRDVSVQLGGATITVSPRNLDENELGLSFKLPNSAEPRSE